MYMGFMKMGISLMGVFFVIVALASFLEIGPLLFVAAIAWFYSFFHVHNLASMPDEEFYAVEDDYLFHIAGKDREGEELQKTYRKVIAVALIFIGVILLWKGIFSGLYNYLPVEAHWVIDMIGYRLPKMVVGIGIIILGVYMIRGRKQRLEEEEQENGEV